MRKGAVQAALPGMAPVRGGPARPEALRPGQAVVYVGRVRGGPDYGQMGRVEEVQGAWARVRFRRGGRWRVPVAFLTVPEEAAVGVS